jgi:hypothetical protein
MTYLEGYKVGLNLKMIIYRCISRIHEKTKSCSPVLWRCLQKNIILIEKPKNENLATILVSLQEGLERVNILSKAVGHRQHRGLPDSMIAVGLQKLEYSILILDID